MSDIIWQLKRHRQRTPINTDKKYELLQPAAWINVQLRRAKFCWKYWRLVPSLSILHFLWGNILVVRTGGNHAERIKDLIIISKEIQARASKVSDLGRRGLIISKSLRIAVCEKCFLSNSICLYEGFYGYNSTDAPVTLVGSVNSTNIHIKNDDTRWMKCLNTQKDSWVSGSDFKKCSKYVLNYCARWRCQFSFLLLLLWWFFFFSVKRLSFLLLFFFCPVINWDICNSEMTTRQELTNSMWVFNSSVNFDNFRTRESINLSSIWIKQDCKNRKAKQYRWRQAEIFSSPIFYIDYIFSHWVWCVGEEIRVRFSF